MHEYPLTLQIIRTATAFAIERGAKRVSKICLVIGESSGVLAESVELYFGIIADGTLCENAKLAIDRVKPKLRCNVCGRLFERRPFHFECTYEGCGGEGEPTEIGREFVLRSIEIE